MCTGVWGGYQAIYKHDNITNKLVISPLQKLMINFSISLNSSKKIVFTICIINLLISNSKVIASEANCYSIKDADLKNYCLASSKNSDSYCFSIHVQDTKNQCLAHVRKQKSYCYSIKDHDTKNLCLSKIK
jgi:hypothetical protein